MQFYCLKSQISLILNELTRRFVEKTIKITYGSSILNRQHYALIYNFDVRFVFSFSDFYGNWLGEIEKRNCFRRSGPGVYSPLRMRAGGRRIVPHPCPHLSQKQNLFLFFFFFVLLEYGYNNNIEENGKDFQRVFDTDLSPLCPHWLFNVGGLKRVTVPHTAPLSPAKGYLRRCGGGGGSCIHYVQYVQSRWGFRTPNMLWTGYKTPTHLDNSDKPDTTIV